MKHCLIFTRIIVFSFCGLGVAGADDKAEARKHFNAGLI